MKKITYYTLWLLAPIALWAQAEEAAPVDIDLSDVIVVEDTAPSEPVESAPVEVVEIPETPVEGASIDIEAPEIPEVTESLPSDTEIVLELPGQEASTPGEATMDAEETISVDFPDEDVRTILRNVADLFELNLVIPDTLQGRTSIKLRNITWRQAFEVVLEPLGYTYVEDRNIIRIKSTEELTTEPVDTRVFVANYASAGDLKDSIAPLVDTAAGGRIQVDKRSNALVITERPSRMNKIQEIIEFLDKATDQVMIESKFIEVANDDIKNIGVNWASLSGYSMSAGPFQRDWSRERSSSDTNTGSAGSDSTSTTTTSSGSISGNPTPEMINTDEEIGSTFSNLAEMASTASTGRVDTAVFSASEFRVVLSALEELRDTKLLTNPTVVVLNNQEAVLQVGQQYPIREFEYNSEGSGGGSLEPGELKYEPLGVNLTVVPSANAAGMINLKVNPKVKVLSGTITTLDGIQDPLFEEKSVSTTVTIKDGYTLALGGLVEQTIQKQKSQVPLLGRLPGLGRLFRSNTDSLESRNLIIFITAKTLNPDGSTYRDIIDPRVLDEMGIVPSELPGYKLDSAEKDMLQQLEDYRMEKKQNEAQAKRQVLIKQIEYKKMQDAEDSKVK